MIRKELRIKDKEIRLKTVTMNISIEGDSGDKSYIEVDEGPASVQTPAAEMILVKEEENSISIEIDQEAEYSGMKSIRLLLPETGETGISAETGNGNIFISRIRGRIKAETRNGKISMEQTGGDIECVCANGSIDGKALDGHIDLSTSNGRVILKESRITGGSVKSGRGRVSLQITPELSENFSIFSGSGRVRLAVPEEAAFSLSVKTSGRLFNDLRDTTAQTQDNNTVIQRGESAHTIYIQNYQGGVSVVDYKDFNKTEQEYNFSFEDNFEDIGNFFRNMFGQGNKGPCSGGWDQKKQPDFEEEIRKMIDKMRKVGTKFGRMGEDISREFHKAARGDDRDEVKMVLEMLQQGKISTEEAARLIEALKRRR